MLETPRSASTISAAQLERFDIQDIDELIVLAPGSFTQSFFGVAGGIDIRGTPGETYFRGMRRLDNPGNYPTPIGASDRIDIIRGPASPIYGPSKIGGYLNFNPKSARIEETGALLAETAGAMSVSNGSWDKAVVSFEAGGPARAGDTELGYYLYLLTEDSGSYYDNAGQNQDLLQLSADLDVSSTARALGATVLSDDALRAGMPENIYSLTGAWDFGNGWTLNGSVADVEEVASGFSRSVRLPGYTLVNLGFGYQTRDWLFSFNARNLADERYFRANFPNLFDGVIALPELPRNYNASVRYSF